MTTCILKPLQVLLRRAHQDGSVGAPVGGVAEASFARAAGSAAGAVADRRRERDSAPADLGPQQAAAVRCRMETEDVEGGKVGMR